MRPSRFKIVCLMVLVSMPFAFAEQKPQPVAPCSAPQQKQFDFWLGTWDLTWPGEKQNETGHGTNTIGRILDDCVVYESFSGGDTMHLRGNSVSLFDVRSGKWKQTWVDNEGGYLDFVGEFNGSQMILSREATRADGSTVKQRMVWKNIRADELDWGWESSQDGGKTWQVLWPIHYKRKKS